MTPVDIEEKEKINKILDDAISSIKDIIPYDEYNNGYDLEYKTTDKNSGYEIKISIEKLIPDTSYL